MRTTFCTLMSKAGVPLRTAQAAMRHSDPSLTANVYTDPRLLDVSGALDALPALPLEPGQHPAREQARATGTDTPDHSFVAPSVATTGDSRGQTLTNRDKTYTGKPVMPGAGSLVVSRDSAGDTVVPVGVMAGGDQVCPTGVEPVTFSSGG
jgi:hypothetical protein